MHYNPDSEQSQLSRRSFLKYASLSALAPLLNACSATGQRSDLQDAQTLRSELIENEYGRSLDDAAQRISYLLREQPNGQGNLASGFWRDVNAYVINTATPNNIDQNTAPLETLLYQNKKLKQIFIGDRITRWTIEGIHRNSDTSDFERTELTGLERDELRYDLTQLTLSLDYLSKTERDSLAADTTNTDTARELEFSRTCLNELYLLATAKGNIEVIEGNIHRMHESFEIAAKVKRSTQGVWEYDVGDSALQNNRQVSLNTIGLVELAQETSFIGDDLGHFYTHLLRSIQATIANPGLLDKDYRRLHIAFQKYISAAYSVPVQLLKSPKITREESTAMKKTITRDIARIFNNADFPPQSQTGEYVLRIIPVFNLPYLLDMNEWRDLVSIDDFEPNGDTLTDRIKNTLQRAEEMGSGAVSEHFVGDNVTQWSLPIGFVTTTTTAALVTYLIIAQNDNGHRNRNNQGPAPGPAPGPNPGPAPGPNPNPAPGPNPGPSPSPAPAPAPAPAPSPAPAPAPSDPPLGGGGTTQPGTGN